MPHNVHTFLFGRLNVLGKWDNKRSFLHQALSSGEIEKQRKFKYGIFNVEDLSLDGEIFASGQLVKYKPLLEGEIVDETKKQVVEGGLPDGVVAKSDFFLHYASGIIAYRPITNRLSEKQFRGMFSRLIEAGHYNFFISAEIRLIEEEYGIIEAVKKFDVIRRISIELHPTNPSNRDLYRCIDERLKKLRAESMRQIVEAKEGGLNKDALSEDEVYKGIVMAADGYGRGRVQGILDGASVTISTGQSPVKKDILDTDNPKEDLSQLMEAFRKIWDRMKR